MKIHPAPAGFLDVSGVQGATAEWRALSRCVWLVANIGYVLPSENGKFDSIKMSLGHYLPEQTETTENASGPELFFQPAALTRQSVAGKVAKQRYSLLHSVIFDAGRF
ncbi:hypothetical protein [Pseudomonas chlororaphis]|uniref:hypothetical protein n=1 Tax=Pseudomonas chlororaphis TaxID=587753 RepID=UPI0011D0453D|nr:hypothetical protein [Pseudomonas chlororaphis]